MAILYEIHTIERSPTGQDFASYCRLNKCQKESAGKSYETTCRKSDNVYLKWAFSDTAVLFLRANPDAQAWLEKMAQRHNKARALTILVHKPGHAVYFARLLHKSMALEVLRGGPWDVDIGDAPPSSGFVPSHLFSINLISSLTFTTPLPYLSCIS